MRVAILFGFLSLWIVSIVVPSVIAIVDKEQESVWMLSHTEEEKQESGEKDKFEEKIVPESDERYIFALLNENQSSIESNTFFYSSHIQDIFLPPPEPMI